MKVCKKCKKEYPVEHFYRDRSKKDGRTPYCRECRKQKAAEQYQKNPRLAIDRANKRRAELGMSLDIQRMGITLEEYLSKLEVQNSRCAICDAEETIINSGVPRRLSIDHDHTCCPQRRGLCGNCVRDLLCSRCNLVLGKVQDDVEVLEKMIGYLNRWKR